VHISYSLAAITKLDQYKSLAGWYVGMPKIYHHLIVQPVNKYAGDGVIRMNNNVIHQIAFGFEQAL
jgi:hypothetical protein